jgi:ABC-type nitrate/sulfonate/bicarbonate transport system substrate-binding protein
MARQVNPCTNQEGTVSELNKQTNGRQGRSRFATRVVTTVACCAAGATLAACSSSGGSSSSAAAGGGQAAAGSSATGTAAMVPVTIAYTAPVADQLIPLIAQDAGLFAKYGVPVTVTYLPQTEAVDGIVGGKVQMAVFDSPAPELAVADGEQIKWIAEWEGHADLFLLGRPGVSSTKDLAGKSVAETVAGSTTAVLTQVALQDAGVQTSAHLQPLGNVGATLSAFQSGSVEATIAGPPNQTTLLKAVPGASVLVNYSNSIPWVGGGLAASISWADSHKAESVDIVKALMAGEQYFKANKAASIKDIELATKSSEADAAGAYASMLAVMNQTTSIVPQASIESVALKAIASTSPGAASLTGASVVDTEFAEAAGN